MQMVEMRVRDENQIDRRKICDPQPGTPKSLKYKQPAREVGVDHHILAGDLHKKTGMTDKGDTQLSIAGKAWFVGLT